MAPDPGSGPNAARASRFRRHGSHRVGSQVPRIVWALGWIAAATILLLIRQRGVPALDSVWADDGEAFLSEALRRGALAPIASSYAGYLNVAPRTLAGATVAFPLDAASTVLSVGSALIVAALSLFAYLTSRESLTSFWSKALLASLVVLLPALGWESMNNATNLQWSLLFPCFLALAAVPPSGPRAAVAALIAVTTATSAPTSIVFAPLAVAALLRRSRSAVVGAAFLVGVAAQLMVVLLVGEDPFKAPTSVASLPGLYGLRVAASLFVGEWVLPHGWAAFGWAFAFAALALGAGLVITGMIRLPARRRWIALTGAYSLVLFGLPVYVRGSSLLEPGSGEFMYLGSKWVIAPILLLALASLMILEAPGEGSIRWWWLAARTVFIIAVMAGVVVGFPVENDRSAGPRWSLGVAQAIGECRHVGASTATIVISPPGWEVRVPCDLLASDP